MTDLAARSDNAFLPLIILMFLVVLGGLLAVSTTVRIIRIARGRVPHQVPPGSPGPWQGRP